MRAMRALHFLEFAAVRAALMLVIGFGVSAQAQPTDADLVAARDAYRAGDAARLDRIAPRLKGHLLEQYVSYWQIRLKLDDADPERVKAFLTRNAAVVLAVRTIAEERERRLADFESGRYDCIVQVGILGMGLCPKATHKLILPKK